ncbi:hypothetical protein MLD38_015312 [Melastoma candidum]|uniref:Uncharacterized protein n=1 Tax=Melastoma candidum TaxID=119954 RepID=A0ACB9RH27_9MYRT|nr:hypothetical protein MLD38_015312 [Melastoma candidum]
MPESRDRLVREMDRAAGLTLCPIGFGSNVFQRPHPLETAIADGTVAITIRREDVIWLTRDLYSRHGGRNLWWMMRMPSKTARGTPAMMRGCSGSGLGANSLLPSWYPRTPLQDITTIARVYDGRRRRLSRLRDGHKDNDLIAQGSSNPNSSSDCASLEHKDDSLFMTPYPSGITNSCKQSVSKILVDVVKTNSGEDSDIITPQRKILNEIDTVREVVLEGIRQFSKTPLAKKAERERKVRVLMSMR